MSKDYIARWFNEDDDIEAYITGLNKALYDEYNEAIYDWKWKKNPNRLDFIPIVVVEHPQAGPVAFNSFLPIEIRRGKKVFRAIQGCDGFVDSEHIRRGLFQRTLIFLEKEKECLEAEFLMGFNLVEAAGAARKAGSELAYDVIKCFIKPENIKQSRKERVKLQPINVETLNKLYMNWAEESQLYNLNRSLDYLHWKTKEHPFKIIDSYGVHVASKLIGYIITDKVAEGEKNTLTINDYNPSLLNKYLSSILESLAALHNNITVIEIDTIQGGEIQRTARSLGFEIVPWYQVIMKALKSTEQREGVIYRNGIKLNHFGNWHLTESDIY